MDSDSDSVSVSEPWLLVSQGKNLETHVFYSTSKNDDEYSTNIPEFNGMRVSSTSFGWLLLIDEIRGQNPLYSCLINPTDLSHKIQLPPLFKPRTDSYSYKCLLSKPPTEPDCHVFLYSGAELVFCRIGDEKFIKQTEILTRGGAFQTATGGLDGDGGKFYALMSEPRSRTDSLVQIDLNFTVQDQLLISLNKLVEIPIPVPENTIWSRNYLVEFSRHELLLLYLICHPHYPQLIRCFKIFKLNPSEKECQELKSIGDHTIFLGHSGISICTKNKPGCSFKSNSIYYIDPPSKSLCVYDISDKSKTFIKPAGRPIKRSCDDLFTFFTKKKKRSCNLKSWIMI